MHKQILIVDDNPKICNLISDALQKSGYNTHVANDGYEALKAVSQLQFPFIILDLMLPGISGFETLKSIRTMAPNTVVIIITGCATIDSAVKAMKLGAYEYITKPFNPFDLVELIESLNAKPSNDQLNIHARSPQEFVTADPEMLELLEIVKMIAKSDSTVLIQGESGTGKEVIAKTIHRSSYRADGPFIAVNCAALSESLIESELFGHEKGAFTGAIARRIGSMDLANGGTLFLDEISEISPSCQAKMLRAIQEREVIRVGGTNIIKLNIRIIASTNRNLASEVTAGKFREDLFYRLSVVPVFLPPLRERRDDTPLLARYFAQCIAAQMGKKPVTLSKEAIQCLREYHWPGNIRELRNVIEQALVLSKDSNITINDINFNTTTIKKFNRYIILDVGASIEEAEKELILKTLREYNNNRQKTADILGITTKTLRTKLREYKVG